MSTIPAHFRLECEPIATPEAVIIHDNVRFTVLTSGLLRLEHHPEGQFVDRPSQLMWFRQQPVPDFSADVTETVIRIETACFRLEYIIGQGEGFTRDNLTIDVKPANVSWHPGDVDAQNLRGTTRTLDFINGYTPLEPGLLSRSGWALIDDSDTLIFNDEGWLEPRPEGGTDLYFFAYGTDYKQCLVDYCAVSGQIPMIPRFILGNWWSRYWAYTQDELVGLLEDFKNYALPFSVCILDMDWHITETNNDSTGWTGYSWNRELFPDPEGFIKEAHQRGLKVGLNLHPAEGIHNHEDQYEAMAKIMGIDPASGDPVLFDITDPTFATAYLSVLHHPYEEMGVDFWWLDWQQGLESKIPGLDPLWFINHLHYTDLARTGDRRSFIFSRWGRQGHQRYPIGFSGDSYATWDTLNFQSYMTATASNIAYGWWSHDIGGHTSGTEDPELLTRWIQFGVLSPINRIHVTKGFFYDRRPWMFEDADVLRVVREALQFRHALIPYIYTEAYRSHNVNLPLIQPMYYDYPEEEAAYHCPHQYMFGTELLAAPFTSPADPTTGMSRQLVWLPEGEWYNVFTGEYHAGDRWQPVYGKLADIPVFARAGAIIPLAVQSMDDVVTNPASMEVRVFAGKSHTFTLYEDDGATTSYHDQSVRTTFTQEFQTNQLTFTIDPSVGSIDLLPAVRTYKIVVRGIQSEVNTAISINNRTIDAEIAYDDATESLIIEGIQLAPEDRLQIHIVPVQENLLSRRNRKRENLIRMLRFFRLNTSVRNGIANELDKIIEQPALIGPYTLTLSEAQKRALCEILFDAGYHVVHDTIAPTLIVLWNNAQAETITYRYNEAYLFFGQLPELKFDNTILPTFRAIIPQAKTWTHGAQNEHVQRTQWRIQVDYDNIATVADEYREVSP